MLLKKLNKWIIAAVCCFSIGCSASDRDRTGAAGSEVKDERPQVTFLLNPNDCQNCLLGFSPIFRYLKTNNVPDKNILFILPGTREKERKEILDSYFPEGSESCVKIWDNNMFDSYYKNLIGICHQSYVLIEKNKKILYAKPLKEIMTPEEFKQYLF